MADESKPANDRPRGLLDGDGQRPHKVAKADDAATDHVTFATLGNIGPALIVLVLAIAATFVVPALEFARPWNEGDPLPYWNVTDRPFEDESERAHGQRVAEVESLADEVVAADEPSPVAQAPAPEPGEAKPTYEPRPEDLKPAIQSLELFGGDELDAFFAALARADAGEAGALVKVVHWGDSSIGLDGIPGAIRRRMQNRFGDGGHGFHLMAPPNTSYLHREVKFRHDGWEHCFIIERCKRDGRYGLGGATFFSYGGGRSTFSPHPERSGGKVARFDLWYAAHPGGGRIRVRVDRGEPQIIETRAEAIEDRWHAIEVDDGPHKLEVQAAGGGRLRMYGVSLERDGPGVIWDSLAWVGAFTNRVLAYDADHLRAQLGHRKPQLAVLTFGGNDLIREKMTMAQYIEEYRSVVQHIKTARPEINCLIMGPLDHGIRKGVRIESLPAVIEMVAAQREVAKAEGCAYFDSFEAMGGAGSAGRWFRRDPRLMSGDLGHVTRQGQQVIGEATYRALVEGYVAYRRRQEGS